MGSLDAIKRLRNEVYMKIVMIVTTVYLVIGVVISSIAYITVN